MDGRVWKTWTLQDASVHTLELDNLPIGLYLLTLQQQNSRYSSPLLKLASR